MNSRHQAQAGSVCIQLVRASQHEALVGGEPGQVRQGGDGAGALFCPYNCGIFQSVYGLLDREHVERRARESQQRQGAQAKKAKGDQSPEEEKGSGRRGGARGARGGRRPTSRAEQRRLSCLSVCSLRDVCMLIYLESVLRLVLILDRRRTVCVCAAPSMYAFLFQCQRSLAGLNVCIVLLCLYSV